MANPALVTPAIDIELGTVKVSGAVEDALAPAASSTPVAQSVTVKAAIAGGACVKGFWVQADYANTTRVRIGDTNVSASRGFQLANGDKHFCECTNTSAWFAVVESGTCLINVILN